MASVSSKPRIAVLYQAVPPPIINGVKKPLKPGGYQDSGSDIAYVLRRSNHEVITPTPSPDPAKDEGWCFPDTEDGILAAVFKGANTLWANTILFSSHPLQTSNRIPDEVRSIGQPPNLVEKYDDKALTNDLLRKNGFALPKAWFLSAQDEPSKTEVMIHDFTYPVVAKPIRGRGSHGVKVCKDRQALDEHIKRLFAESAEIMVEEFLDGEEATVTVMPPIPSPASSLSIQTEAAPEQTQFKIYPQPDTSTYYSLPIVTRFNHEDGVAPYNGVVAVTANSRAITPEEHASDPAYAAISRECEAAAELLRPTAPIRIDVRRVSTKEGAKFAMFDVNMKPNATGPGRPGRENQASLTAIAASALGWNYAQYLEICLKGARELRELRRWK
ncbi:hypothetical protein F5884DRAFT_818996 [Xylogone sp. PMI_703]|nr:hypothetical protein F5884DRAFT_818996 [Xylogone sp. PMI_703]